METFRCSVCKKTIEGTPHIRHKVWGGAREIQTCCPKCNWLEDKYGKTSSEIRVISAMVVSQEYNKFTNWKANVAELQQERDALTLQLPRRIQRKLMRELGYKVSAPAFQGKK